MLHGRRPPRPPRASPRRRGGFQQDLADHLDAFLHGEARAAVADGRSPRDRQPSLAFIFSGMGPQWWGMGRQLIRDEPVVPVGVGGVRSLAPPHRRLVAARRTGRGQRSLPRRRRRSRACREPRDPGRAHRALALVGNRPRRRRRPQLRGDGGSVGGRSAVAPRRPPPGVPPRPAPTPNDGDGGDAGRRDLARCVARSCWQITVPESRSPPSMDRSRSPSRVSSKRSVGSPTHSQVSGRFCRLLPVNVPYHGPQMDPLRDELMTVLANIDSRPPTIPVVSTATGTWHEERPFDAGYWWRNVRQPVLFADAIDHLSEIGCELFVEVGPHPVLGNSINECLAHSNREGTVLPSLRRGDEDREVMLRSLARLYARGRKVEWSGVVGQGHPLHPPPALPVAARAPLVRPNARPPVIPFPRRRFGPSAPRPPATGRPPDLGVGSGRTPALISRRTHAPRPGRLPRRGVRRDRARRGERAARSGAAHDRTRRARAVAPPSRSAATMRSSASSTTATRSRYTVPRTVSRSIGHDGRRRGWVRTRIRRTASTCRRSRPGVRARWT